MCTLGIAMGVWNLDMIPQEYILRAKIKHEHLEKRNLKLPFFF